jgi:hypothetical protein
VLDGYPLVAGQKRGGTKTMIVAGVAAPAGPGLASFTRLRRVGRVAAPAAGRHTKTSGFHGWGGADGAWREEVRKR